MTVIPATKVEVTSHRAIGFSLKSWAPAAQLAWVSGGE